MLPAVGQVLARGQSVYAMGGQPAVLMYGSVVPSRAFVAGMSPGKDVAALNANLECARLRHRAGRGNVPCSDGSGDPGISVRATG